MALLGQPAIGIQLDMAGDGSETTSVYQHRVEDLCERLQEAGVSERSIGQGVLVEQWKRTCLTRWRIDDQREGINTNVHIWAVCGMSEFAYFHEDPINQALAYLYALAYFAGTNAEDLKFRTSSLLEVKARQSLEAPPSWSLPSACRA